MLALLLPAAIGLWAAIWALIWPAFRALLFWGGLVGRRPFSRRAFLAALIWSLTAAIRAPVIAARALFLALMLPRLKTRRALLADARGRGGAKVFLIKGFRRDQPEAHGIQHWAKVFALDPQAAGQIAR